jgi:hypothetical protein
MTTFSETTLPALIFSVPAGHPKGDVPALGRLTVNEAQAVDQWWVTWGSETNDLYTHTDSTGSGALFYEAETRTALGGSATAVGTAASGAGSNVMRYTPTTSFVSMLSTQATGGGAHLTHVGSFRVYARMEISTLAQSVPVTVALEWGYGDFKRFTRNAETELLHTDASTWRLLDLGIVIIPKTLIGSQRWEGRIIAKTETVGNVLDVDYLMLVPVDIASGVASAVAQAGTATSVLARDDFVQAAGNLTGKTAPVGGNWVGAGDAAPDWTVGTLVFSGADAHAAGRQVSSGATDTANTGRWCTLDINQAGVYVSADLLIRSSTGSLLAGTVAQTGLIARYADTNNWLGFFVVIPDPATASPYLALIKRVAGTLTTIATQGLGFGGSGLNIPLTFALSVDSTGKMFAYAGIVSAPLTLLLSAQDTALATAGALASGDVGIYSEVSAYPLGSMTHLADNLQASPITSDAAMFASQSLEIRHNGVIREDSGGTTWQQVSSYEGDFLRVPVTGREGRSIRYIVKACRNDPASGPDSGIDDISATLAVTPRYLSVPAPA